MGREILQRLEDGVGRMLLLWDVTQNRSTPGEVFLNNYIDHLSKSIAGVALGQMEQVELYHSFIMHQEKTPIEPHGVADVATLGKAVQLKVVSASGASAAQGHLKTAIVQISGARGETPRPGQKRQVLIHIWPDDNPWPFSRIASTPNQFEYEQEAANRIRQATSDAMAVQPSRGQRHSLPDFLGGSRSVPVDTSVSNTTARRYTRQTRQHFIGFSQPPPQQGPFGMYQPPPQPEFRTEVVEMKEHANMTVRVRWPRGRLMKCRDGLARGTSGFKASVAKNRGTGAIDVRIVKWYGLDEPY